MPSVRLKLHQVYLPAEMGEMRHWLDRNQYEPTSFACYQAMIQARVSSIGLQFLLLPVLSAIARKDTEAAARWLDRAISYERSRRPSNG